MSSREIFNRLIEKKWQEQYTDDIRYMVDMAHNRGVTTVLPFYEQRFNQFASTIPWKLANKTMAGLDGFSNKPVRVNKYVLRKAFEKELPWNIIVRADDERCSGYSGGADLARRFTLFRLFLPEIWLPSQSP